MRNLIALVAIVAVISAQGCYSYVKTYDSKGNLVGECNSGGMLLGFIPTGDWGFMSACRGSANPLEQSANETLRPVAQEKAPLMDLDMSCPAGTTLRGNECYPDNPLLKQMLEGWKK
ncbi:MAG: hypothetical protein AAB091_04400 [Elusimicrobiota bacterium]